MNQQIVKGIINGLSALIMSELRAHDLEMHSPRGDADSSDAYIKARRKVLGDLRRIRDEFENTVAEV